MPVKIKKRLELGFLGEDYKGCYVVLNKLAISEIQDYDKRSREVIEDNVKSALLILEEVKKHFVEGKFIDEGNEIDLKADDLGDFDYDTIEKLFFMLTGYNPDTNQPEVENADPKELKPS